jgi:hypothetical protein
MSPSAIRATPRLNSCSGYRSANTPLLCNSGISCE